MARDRFVVRSEEAEEGATRLSHPWNPHSELYGTRLGELIVRRGMEVENYDVSDAKEFGPLGG